jgi:hypothetical protein
MAFSVTHTNPHGNLARKVHPLRPPWSRADLDFRGSSNANGSLEDGRQPGRRDPGGGSTLGVLAKMPATIRPALKSLRSLPTLYQISECWGKLELKLETTDTRYWVTTEGVPQKTNGAPINYVVDYVTVEKLTEEGHWDLKAVYSPDAWRLSQGFDYCQVLQQELTALRDQLDRHFRWETLRKVEEVERELQMTNLALADLSAKVKSRNLA